MNFKKYRHYKGTVYEIIGIARHSETLEEMVVYRDTIKKDEKGNDIIWVRPKEMFFEKVVIDGKEILRFTPLNN